MSLLERFGIVFDSNAADATKENEKLAKSFDKVDESAEKATGKTEKNTKAVTDGRKALDKKALTLGTLTRRFLGVAAAIKIATSTLSSLQNTTSVGRIATDLNLNVEAMEKFALTSKRLGGSASDTRATIGNLRTSIEGLSIGQNLDLFEKLQFAGASVFGEGGEKKDVFTILGEISKFFQTLTPERALQRGENAGLDIGLIRLLKGDLQGQLSITEDLGVITKEQTESARKLSESMDKLGQIWDTIGREAIEPLVPVITDLSKDFLEFSKSVREFLGVDDDGGVDDDQSFMGAVADSISGFFSKENILGTEKEQAERTDRAKKALQDDGESGGFGPDTAPQWFKDLMSTKDQRADKSKQIMKDAREVEAARQRGREAASTGGVPFGPGASSAITNNSQQSSNSVHVDQINIDAGGNANAADIASNVGKEIEGLAAVNSQYSSGILA